jgi:alkanesulfonate monooxygenase SsuD/methylene tetrahydromethanopterin reductase-like flavin-dependent oxidoreductase (luciferase family)
MVATAGDLVAEGLLDGVMVNYLHTTERVGEIAVELRGRAERAGRDPDGVQVQAVVMVAPGDDEATTVAQIRAGVAANPMLRHEAGFGPDDEISDDDVRFRVAAGPAWTARVDEYLRAGATGVTLFARDPSAVLNEASGWR